MLTFVLFHQPGPDWEEGVPYPEQPGIDAHFEFARKLANDGHLLMGGPFVDEASGGMLVIQAESLDRAEMLANEDASIGGLLRVTVRPWRIAMSTIDLAAAAPSSDRA